MEGGTKEGKNEALIIFSNKYILNHEERRLKQLNQQVRK